MTTAQPRSSSDSEDAKPGEQELRLISSKEFDPAVVGHREVVLVGDGEEFTAEVSGPGEDCDVAELRGPRFAVLVFDGVGPVPDETVSS